MPAPTFAEIVTDVKRVAKRLGKKAGDEFSLSEYLENEPLFSRHSVYTDGDGWIRVCQAAGFVTKGIIHEKGQKLVSDDEYIDRLKLAVAKLGRYPKNRERKRYQLNFPKTRWTSLSEFIDDGIQRGLIPDLRIRETDSILSAPPAKLLVAEKVVLAKRQTKSRITPPIPARTRRKKWERTGVDGLPYAPQDESGVVALFGILCANRTLNWDILEINGGKGLDAICFDHDQHTEIHVELKYRLSRTGWNHNTDEIDYVVCWENRWKDFPKPVIELRKLLQKQD